MGIGRLRDVFSSQTLYTSKFYAIIRSIICRAYKSKMSRKTEKECLHGALGARRRRIVWEPRFKVRRLNILGHQNKESTFLVPRRRPKIQFLSLGGYFEGYKQLPKISKGNTKVYD